MISYIHFPLIALCVFILTAIWRLWVCIDRLGFMREVSRRAPSMFQGHLLAAVLAIVPFLIATVSWFGITLPEQTAPMNAYLAAFMSAACLGCCLLLLKNSMEYLAFSWAGSRVDALRVVAMLRIIDAAELAYALQYVQEQETKNGPVIDAQTVREVSK
ncbi:hypothetical protein [Paraburkholderia hayleyella]|uniref:hypothetical protein n=1 Tax=Paraburkholderia hayleyella TaxID=2152889 RepID=UPI001290A537|nr:hypothetical protein [Paraburkholderia hayleyella]